MTRANTTSTIAALAGLALAAVLQPAMPAAAQPSLEQTGDGYHVVYGNAERGPPAGGRIARMEGGGDNATVVYTGPDMLRPGPKASLSGGGEGATITYVEPMPAPATNMAGGAARRDVRPRG